MSTEVIILAQGTQKRLGTQHGYKQLLPLPACGGTPILVRTLRQLREFGVPNKQTTVVAWNSLAGSNAPDGGSIPWAVIKPEQGMHPWTLQLQDPGNSSLKGIARYLELAGGQERGRGRSEVTIVLLGDVVYSWRCLEAIVTGPAGRHGGPDPGFWFVGTRDLSASGGELWGIGWKRSFEESMIATLGDALLRHPPFEDEYQPGQLRRWITGWRRGDLVDHVQQIRRTNNYIDVDDYTRDIDTPAHLALIPQLSEVAAADDALHGVIWNHEGRTP